MVATRHFLTGTFGRANPVAMIEMSPIDDGEMGPVTQKKLAECTSPYRKGHVA